MLPTDIANVDGPQHNPSSVFLISMAISGGHFGVGIVPVVTASILRQNLFSGCLFFCSKFAGDFHLGPPAWGGAISLPGSTYVWHSNCVV